MTPSRNFVVGARFVGLAWIVGGIIMAAAAVPRVVAGLSSRYWPHVTGQIVTSKLSAVKNSNKGTAFYKVRIVYDYSPPSPNQYAYAFRGQRISDHGFVDPTDDSYTLKQARELSSQYSVGKRVAVFYSPNNMQKSTLQPGIDFGTFGGSLFGFGLVLLGTFLLIKFAAMPTS